MTRCTLTTADLTLLIKKMSEAQDKAIRDFTNQWSERGVVGLFHTKDTNAYTLEFKDRHNLEKALPKIKKNPNVSLYYIKPDQLKQVSNAIENLDYFKAFTLCVTLYESYGKDILISQFKDKPSLAQDITNKLVVSNIIYLLYKHGMIEKDVRSQI
jgi:hypothetical protein